MIDTNYFNVKKCPMEKAFERKYKKLLFFFMFYCVQEKLLSIGLSDNIILKFSAPIECTKVGIKNFITQTYNHCLYKDFLGACLIHIIDLLEFAYKKNNCCYFVQQILSLFMQKAHESASINPYSLLYFIQHSLPFITEILASESLQLEKEISAVIETCLLKDSELLHTKPEQFIKKQTALIIEASKKNLSNHLKIQTLYSKMIEFLCSKLFFDLSETIEACECFEKLLNTVDYAFKNHIIADEETFQQIQWALCSRWSYCFNLQKKMIGNQDVNFIKKHTNINLKKILSGEEIDNCILTKIQFLNNNYLMVGDAGFEPTTPSL